LASQSDTVFASGFPAEGVDWRDIGGSFYNSLGAWRWAEPPLVLARADR